MPDKEQEIPELCKDCPNSGFFKKEGTCNVYWEGKKDCASRFWLEKNR
ncbi:hypothetical protein GF351_02105 [Candidatus Woesearchaeota archaeon]|nr:hypothetical protein [Candidatus Woesearchaeota archaeon]